MSAVLACAVCFGDPSNALTDGAIAGVLVLGGVIVAVLTWIILVARFWMKRARALAAEQARATAAGPRLVGASDDGVVLYLGRDPGGASPPPATP